MAEDIRQKYSYIPDMLGTPISSVPRDRRVVPLTEEAREGMLPEQRFGDDIHWGTPSDKAKLATLPGHTGGGQYVTDPSQAGVMFKYDRDVPERLKRYARQGLPSSAFEVDHIVPLSLGGTNDPENLQVLNYKEHDIKTKVGAVVNELYFNNKIGLNDAKNKVINFKNLDVSDVAYDENGRMPVSLAEAVYKSWGEEPKTSVTDVLKEIPKVPGMLLGKAGEAVGEVLPENVFGEFGKGVAESMTLDWMDVPTEEYATEKQQLKADIARGAGKVAGFIASFGLMYKVAGMAAGAMLGSKALKGTQFAKWVKTASAPVTSKNAAFKLGSVVFPKNVALKTLQNAGAFALHGQLSKQQQEGFDERVKRFFFDTAYGGVLSVPGYTMKGYAGLAASAYTLSALEGSTPAEALMNTAIITGLHGVGGLNYRFVKAGKLDAMATAASARVLRKWGLEPKTIYRNPRKAAQQMTKDRGVAVNKIMREVSDPIEMRNEMSKFLIAQRQYYKGGLAREARFLEDVADIKSLTQRTLKMDRASLDALPPEATITTNRLLSPFYTRGKTTAKATEKKYEFPIDPDGVPVTGVSSKNAPLNALDMQALQKLGIKNGDRVIFYKVEDPRVIELVKRKNQSRPAAERDLHPENIINGLIIREGKAYRFGTLPSERRIGSTYNRATGQKVVEIPGEYKNSINKKAVETGVPQANPNVMNKNAIADAMNKNGWKYAVGEVWGVPRGTGVGVASGEAWGRVRFTEQTVQESARYNQAVNLIKSRQTGEPISKVKKSIDDIVEMNRRVQTEEASASSAIARLAPRSEADSLFLTVKGFEQQLAREGGAKRFFQQNIENLTTRTMTDAEKKVLIDKIKAKDMTVGDYVTWLGREKASGTTTGKGNSMFEYLLGPTSSYTEFNPTNRAIVDSFKIRPAKAEKIDSKKVGEIQQKLPLEEPKKQTEAKVGEQIKMMLEKEKTSKKEKIPEVTERAQKAAEAGKERVKTDIKSEVPPKESQVIRREKTDIEATPEKPTSFSLLRERVKDTRAPKQQRADSIAKEYETIGKEALENVDIGSQGRGSLSIRDYGAKLQSVIETLRPPVRGKINKRAALNEKELARVREDIKPTLYQHALDLMRRNFEPKSQASFSGKSVKDIEKEYLRALGLNEGVEGKMNDVLKRMFGEGEALGVGKAVSAKERIEGWKKRDTTDKAILELLGRNPKELDKLRTKQVETFKESLEKNIKKFKGTDTYAEGYNAALNEGLEKMFGKNYASGKKSWALNSFFNPSTTKGKLFWDKMGLRIAPKGAAEAQPKNVLRKEYELIVEKGKPFTEWEKKDWDYVYGGRKREVQKGQESRELGTMATETTGKVTGEPRKGIMEGAETQMVATAKDARGAGLSVGDKKIDEFVTELSGWDMINKMKLAGEAGKPLTARAGAADAQSTLIALQKAFNSYAKPGQKVFLDFKEMKNIINKYK